MLEEMLPLVRLFFPGTASADTPGPSCKEAWRERMPEQTWGGDGRRQGRNEGAEGGVMIGSEERHQAGRTPAPVEGNVEGKKSLDSILPPNEESSKTRPRISLSKIQLIDVSLYNIYTHKLQLKMLKLITIR
ncbi:uncharacterized protein LOC115091956 isoform X2 [Rhinatrema bivittatum]|uniref:uncharacterized protein LOC115091956 isoform X2 n=1 Tax=Rhinatrema bivittatum TaxID=194408 RepID=UPI0011261D54|nr:uncharacterized protein LOC115091956 isoform X2 [Rhinatrema bivittatum]